MQVKRSLEWLHGESTGNKRYAAVLILRQMAENAPAVFNVHVRSFIEIVWAGLRDSKVLVREASVAALRVSCLASLLYHLKKQQLNLPDTPELDHSLTCFRMHPQQWFLMCIPLLQLISTV